jgi:hypothetical protein
MKKMIKAVATGLAVVLTASGCGGASASPPASAATTTTTKSSPPAAHELLLTDAQAENYVKTLKSFHGVSLVPKQGSYQIKMVFCTNGYYSKTEQRTGKHLPGSAGRTNSLGEDVFPSFGCSVTVGPRTFGLYAVPRAEGAWTVTADR